LAWYSWIFKRQILGKIALNIHAPA